MESESYGRVRKETCSLQAICDTTQEWARRSREYFQLVFGHEIERLWKAMICCTHFRGCNSNSDGQNSKDFFYGHSRTLAARCPYFSA
jgi:hypothetical protein